MYRIKFGLAPNLIEQLLDGQLDAVIATQKIPRPELAYKLVAEEIFWLVAPPEVLMPIASEVLTDLAALEQWMRKQPLIAYSEDLPIIRRFWRVVFGCRLDITPKLVLPDLCMIRQAIVAGFGFSVLPDYLCAEMVESNALRLILQPTNAVTNQLWLAHHKSFGTASRNEQRPSPQVTMLMNLLESKQ